MYVLLFNVCCCQEWFNQLVNLFQNNMRNKTSQVNNDLIISHVIGYKIKNIHALKRRRPEVVHL